MTKDEYIKTHPKSMLAHNLATNDWPDHAEIVVIGGLIAPNNKCSNLYKALQKSETGCFCVGGHRMRGTEGWWIAVELSDKPRTLKDVSKKAIKSMNTTVRKAYYDMLNQ